MDEYTADAFANRDEPLPLIAISRSELDASSPEADVSGRREKIKRSFSPSRLKTKGQDFVAAQLEKNEASPGTPGGKLSLQDRLFSKYASPILLLQENKHDSSMIFSRR